MTANRPTLPEFDIDHLSLSSSISAETTRSSPGGGRTPLAVDNVQLGMASSSTTPTPRLTGIQRQSSSQSNSGGLGLLVHGSEQTTGLSRRSSATKGKEKETEGDVIETNMVTIERHLETGRKMINQYLVLDLLGKGAHGDVRRGRDMSFQETADEENDEAPVHYVAIKMVKRTGKKTLSGFTQKRLARMQQGESVQEGDSILRIRREIAIFKKVNHPNVVRLKEVIDDPESSKIFMILEFCEGGEIKWMNEDGGPALSLIETRRIIRDSILGLEYLHHQGIIHRDIKPANLLYSQPTGTVKISDFGCSHYSDALRVASSGAGHDPDEAPMYIDEHELAKTVGSPMFYAPEMCYTGYEPDAVDLDISPAATPLSDKPAFTFRPPSTVDEGSEDALTPFSSNDSSRARAQSSAPASLRSLSSHTLQLQKQMTKRQPITDAIDVWALGVTLYCLLFGQTPFDAPNTYILMQQVIPVVDYPVPPTIGKEQLRTGGRLGQNAESQDVEDVLDLLSKMLEKDPAKRIRLSAAKRHPFIIKGITDQTEWLAKTDPQAQTSVTVSNDEVAAAITKSSAFRDKFRRGFKNFSNKLQVLASGGARSRSKSIGGQDDDSGASTTVPSNASSAAPSVINLQALQSTNVPGGVKPTSRVHSGGSTRDGSPLPSPASTLTRRFSLLGSRQATTERVASPNPPSGNAQRPAASPRRSTVQLVPTTATPSYPSPAGSNDALGRSVSSSQASTSPKRGFIVHRRMSTHLAPPPHRDLSRSAVTTHLNSEDESLPHRLLRSTGSSTSLDQVTRAPGSALSTEQASISPSDSICHRQSTEVDASSRQRSSSIASHASGFGKLVRLLSRNSSQRSGSRILRKNHPKQASGTSGASDQEDSASTSGTTSPVDTTGRMSLDDPLGARQSLDTFESGSVSSRGVFHSPDHLGYGHETGNGPLRRGSNLSEPFHAPMDEEIDWDGDGGSGDDDEDYGQELRSFSRIPRSAEDISTGMWRLDATNGWRGDVAREGLGLNIPDSSKHAPPASSTPSLPPIQDSSPTALSTVPIHSVSPVTPPQPSALLLSPQTHEQDPKNLSPTHPSFPSSDFGRPRSMSRTSARSSPLRGPDRARSPLGSHGTFDGDARSPLRLNPSVHGPVIDDDDEDEGLAIDMGKRGRKASNTLLNRPPPPKSPLHSPLYPHPS